MTNIAIENYIFFFMGKSTISMAIFNSYVKLPEGNWYSNCYLGQIACNRVQYHSIPTSLSEIVLVLLGIRGTGSLKGTTTWSAVKPRIRSGNTLWRRANLCRCQVAGLKHQGRLRADTLVRRSGARGISGASRMSQKIPGTHTGLVMFLQIPYGFVWK